MLLKHSVSGKPLSFEESKDVALDMIILSVGAIVVLYVQSSTGLRSVDLVTVQRAYLAAQKAYDAGAVDSLLAAILLYVRSRRHLAQQVAMKVGRTISPTNWASGIAQLSLGAFALIWTILAV